MDDDATPFRYDVSVYQPPSTFSLSRLLAWFPLVLAYAIACGFVANFCNSLFDEISWVWTFMLGGAVGIFCSIPGIRQPHLRHARLAFLCGALAGALGYVSMHYFAYRDAVPRIAMQAKLWANFKIANLAKGAGKPAPGVPPVELAEEYVPKSLIAALKSKIEVKLNAGQPPQAVRQEAYNFIDQSLDNFTLSNYLEYRATRGIHLAVINVQGANAVTYSAAIFYWSVEFILVALIGGTIFCAQSQFPCCILCDSWLGSDRALNRLHLKPEPAKLLFENGTLMDLAGADVASPNGSIVIKVNVCPQCGQSAPITVQVFQATVGPKKVEIFQPLTQKLVYPGSAYRCWRRSRNRYRRKKRRRRLPRWKAFPPGQSHLIPHKKAKNGLARFVVPACLQALLLDAAFGRFVLPQ